MNTALSIALIPVYLLCVHWLAKLILWKIPQGKLKSLLTRRIGSE